MAICARCKVEQTELYEHNVPICVTCATIQEEKWFGVSRPLEQRRSSGGSCDVTSATDGATESRHITKNACKYKVAGAVGSSASKSKRPPAL